MENCLECIRRYLEKRARLGSYCSEFQCAADCTRPGCKDKDLHIPVSIMDLIGAAAHLDEPIFSIYRRYYSLSLLSQDHTDWIWMVSLMLNKPCPFLKNDLCCIYPVRPLPCMLFPESLALENEVAEKGKKPQYRHYRCLQGPIRLTPKRTEALKSLRRMWYREWRTSIFYLFGFTPFLIDLGNLRTELLQAARQPIGADGTGNTEEPLHRIPFKAIDRFFKTRITACEPLAGADEKIKKMREPKNQRQLYGLLTDDLLSQVLAGGNGSEKFVFRFIDGRLKPVAARSGFSKISDQFNPYL
ncbi:MAG: YkgJ family cysteine cluster protein [Deltaproteobacteria bacterium]|nr:YkgJ family cysteine cluster protein [Deltaproteobacteria bacterium]